MKKLFAKTLAVIIAVMLILSAMPIAFAADEIASGTAGEGVNWVLDASGTLTISGEGEIVVDWYAPPWENYINDIYVVDIQEGITSVPSTAFCYAENLVSVNVPASVTDMDENVTSPFWSCYALQEINVHEDNEVYTSVDGIVYNKDQTDLCFYPPNKAGETFIIPSSVTTLSGNSFNYTQNIVSLTLPDTVTTLNEDTFYSSKIKSITLNNNITVIPDNCFSDSLLEGIVIPDSVETIEYGAFYCCFNLKNVTIGSGVKTIANSIFNYCDELTTIHYTGTEAQWNEIAIHEENEYLNNMAIHYVTDEMYKAGFAADCETDGHTGGIYCEDCETFVTGSVIYAPGHNYQDGVCSECKQTCKHIHKDFDNICDLCGQDAPMPSINVGETKNVYIKEKHGTNLIMFTATQSGAFALTSDIGNNEVDPYVTLYDSNGNEINYNDDGGIGLNFELTFNTIAGESYYFELSSYGADSSYTITLDKYFAFLHQPTAEAPYAVFSWDNAELQWYTATQTLTPVTLNNAQTVSYEWGSSSYDSQSGWEGVACSPQGDTLDYDFFTIPLKAGEGVTVELFGDYSGGVGLWDYEQEEGPYCELTDASTYTLTVANDGNYTLYTYSESGNATVKANCVNFTFNKINGQTDAKLKNPIINTKYACVATIEGITVTSNIFEYNYFISHQPTSAEPYVALNEKAPNAKYQWYQLEGVIGEITDAEAEPFTMHGGDPAYYDENGWTGNYTSEGTSADFFTIPLEEGEEITVETYGNVTSVTLYTPEYGSLAQTEYPDENGVVTFTAPMSMSYYISAECDLDAKIRAYKEKDVSSALEGQITDTLTESIVGTRYFCEVTIDDDLIVSDVFTCVYAIIHQPTWKEPFVELNDATNATYQWYSVEIEQVEITDQDEVIADVDEFGILSSYDEQNGWSGMRADPETIVYFATPLNKGDKITFTASDDAAAVAILDVLASTENNLSITEASFNQDGTATLTVPADSMYFIMVNSTTDTAIKVYRPVYNLTAIDGETSAELKSTDKGIFVCEVTFADGSSEMSEILNTNYILGDVNDDGSINGRDYALLLQYLNDWDVTINESAADVNNDGNINGRDYSLLLQYLNDWDVTLG